jgi:cobalt transporter subunit CbtB
MPSPVAHHQELSLSATRSTALWPALAAFALGLALLYVVGFAGPQLIHDAAHDTRHSLNFPCH